MAQTSPPGIYIHVPFCGRKCPYCDFYSVPASVSQMNDYTETMIHNIESYREKRLFADTLYFGGGTPNLLGGERLARLIETAVSVFSIPKVGEITVECNPATTTPDFLEQIRKAGANRLSFGVQSSDPEELKLLGRRHTPEQAAGIVRAAKETGFANISLDLMLGIPRQTEESLRRSVEYCAALEIQHVSAYLLKIEPGTPFYKEKERLSLPDEDTVSDRYLLAAELLEQAGFSQYEVSNFAKDGFAGRHNLKYWRCEPYLGFGPAAHSFYGGRRFYHSPSLKDFLLNKPPVPDGTGGDREEFALLRLRLTEGLSDEIWQERFHEPIPDKLLSRARRFEKPGLIRFSGERSFSLTKQGFLVSNRLLAELMESFSE